MTDATAAANPDTAEYLVLPFPIGTNLKEIEKSAILTTLAREGGNRSKTAAVLEISLPTLRAKLRTYINVSSTVARTDINSATKDE
ncbi:MAG: hypothetical protein OXU51_13870 [Candidatus Poribacteria bacterium]|nr:hypothetical protein [Candidatus Poribacteria bacterium]